MPDVSYFLLTAALSLLATTAGVLDGRRNHRRVQVIAVALLLLLIGKAVLAARPAWEAALFPWADYAYFQGYWIWPLALYFFGLLVGQCRAGWNRRVIGAIAAGVLACSLWSQRWMVTGFDDRSPATADVDHHCVQTDPHTCVPASCVSLLSYWGIPATEGEMVRLCLTRGGTTVFNAYRGLLLKAGERGLRVRIVETDAWHVLSLGVPVLFGDGRHARVLSVEDGLCVVHDPALPTAEVWPVERVAQSLRGPVVAIDSDVAGPAPTPSVAAATARRGAAVAAMVAR